MRIKPESDSLTACALQPRIELTGNRRCVIEGLQCICEYRRERIKMNMGDFVLCLLGDALYINCFSPQGAIIEGTILRMEFEDNA